ncbi:MAG: hypothetical protein NTW06_02945 [Candidatus Falkowbacteria bacterium]|nr:hypothetical protein [Candidatus Falkowbacteria bacterium]
MPRGIVKGFVSFKDLNDLKSIKKTIPFYLSNDALPRKMPEEVLVPVELDIFAFTFNEDDSGRRTITAK